MMYSYARGYIRRIVSFDYKPNFTRLTKAPGIFIGDVDNDCLRLYGIPHRKVFYIPFKVYGFKVQIRY